MLISAKQKKWLHAIGNAAVGGLLTAAATVVSAHPSLTDLTLHTVAGTLIAGALSGIIGWYLRRQPHPEDGAPTT